MRGSQSSCPWALMLLSACVDLAEMPVETWDAPRVLGIVVEPPEVEPGAQVRLELLWAQASGPVSAGAASWTFCLTPRASSEPGFASESCLLGKDPALSGHGLSVSADVPYDACNLFAASSALDLRPRDPDGTGGYYQPLRVLTSDGELALARLRIRCPLGNAPLAVAQDYAKRYVSNASPELGALKLDGRSAPTDEIRVPVASRVTLALSITAVSHERYVVYDATRGALRERRERLWASWFVTRGELGAAEADVRPGEPAENVWQTPEAAGGAHLWVVVRDDRGGLSYRAQALRVVTDP